MKLRKFPAVAAATVLTMVLAACGSSTTTTTTPASSAGTTASAASTDTAAESSAPVEPATSVSGPPAVDPNADLVIWADDKASKALTTVIKPFEDANGVTVSVQTIGSELQTNFVTASQAGQGPDLVLGAHDWIGNLVQNGTIEPVQLDAAAQKLYNPLALTGVTYNGQIYGVPFAVENIFLVRNTEMAPDLPATMEALVAKGKELVAAGTASEIMALQVGAKGDAYHSYPLYTSAGGYLFGKNADGSYNKDDLGMDKDGAIAAAKKFGELGAAGALKTSIGGDNVSTFFTGKKTAFWVTGPWNLADIKKAGIKYEISAIPPFDGMAEARPFVGVQAMYVAAKGTHKALAEEFASNYFGTDEVATALYAALGRPPALLSAVAAVSATDPDIAKEAEAGKNGDILPAIPEMAQIWDPFGNAEAAIVGGADPTSTMQSAAAQVKAAITK